MTKTLLAALAVTLGATTALADDGAPITTAPEGETVYYDRVAYGWYIYAGSNNLQYGRIPGPSKIVWTADDQAYIYNPLTANQSNTYLQCQVEGDKLVAHLPQVLTIIEDNEGERPLYIGKMEVYSDDNGYTYLPTTEADATVTWTIHADGTITMDHSVVMLDANGKFVDPTDPPTDVLGTYYYGIDDATLEYGPIWNAVADWGQTYTPVVMGQITTMPEGITPETWRMTSKGGTRIVDIAWDGDEVYIGNLTQYAEGALKGYVYGDKVAFPTRQYLGFNTKYNTNVWFLSATAVYMTQWGMQFLERFERTEALEFTLDREAGTLTSDTDACFLINSSDGETNYYEYVVDPNLQYLPPEGMNANPLDPVVLIPGRPEGFDGLLYSVDIPAENVNGKALNTNEMYYNIYLNGELWEFCRDTYIYFDQDYIDIPYSYTDQYDLQIHGTVHDLYLQEEGITTIGIVSCLRGSDGVIYKSNLVTTEVNGIDAVISASEVVDVEYHTLTGVKIGTPTSGIYLRTVTYADGTRSTRKITLR